MNRYAYEVEQADGALLPPDNDKGRNFTKFVVGRSGAAASFGPTAGSNALKPCTAALI